MDFVLSHILCLLSVDFEVPNQRDLLSTSELCNKIVSAEITTGLMEFYWLETEE